MLRESARFLALWAALWLLCDATGFEPLRAKSLCASLLFLAAGLKARRLAGGPEGPLERIAEFFSDPFYTPDVDVIRFANRVAAASCFVLAFAMLIFRVF